MRQSDHTQIQAYELGRNDQAYIENVVTISGNRPPAQQLRQRLNFVFRSR